ncbi:MAG: S-methyl-5-thioribose-1-phosphate isomerase [Pseudomonadota bacterium]
MSLDATAAQDTGEALCSLRWNDTRQCTEVIDQTQLPHVLEWIELSSLKSYCHAIAAMQVRGAPLIGITAAFGLAQAIARDSSDASIRHAKAALLATRPTAVNLRWALDRIVMATVDIDMPLRAAAALALAQQLRHDDIQVCGRIGQNGLGLLRDLSEGEVLNVMTHCNAGWLATIEWGTALAPIYQAQMAGFKLHVWVSETRPRNQGMSLTAWELERAGVPCTIVADSACGHLMREKLVDCVIVGTDRTAANGDVCNKIGTYLKALAAKDNRIPFYVALPTSTIDWQCASGDDIPIEQRDSNELLCADGLNDSGNRQRLRMAADGVKAQNPAFDITPAAMVSGLITELGIVEASEAGLASLREKLQANSPQLNPHH